MSPFPFLGLSFFHRRSFLMSPFAFFGLPLFSSDVFFDEPMNERSESMPLFVSPLVCAKALDKCQAKLVSYFDPTLS
jgi:hypothetical protein